MEDEMKDAQVSCLSGIIDLQRLCQKQNLKLSTETNQYLVYLTLKKLGPFIAQKLISKRKWWLYLQIWLLCAIHRCSSMNLKFMFELQWWFIASSSHAFKIKYIPDECYDSSILNIEPLIGYINRKNFCKTPTIQ